MRMSRVSKIAEGCIAYVQRPGDDLGGLKVPCSY